MTVPRFHLPSASPGARLSLPEHTAHHVREVLRLRAGATVRIFDGVGQEFEGALDTGSRREVVVRLGRLVVPRPESQLHIILALSPLKGDRMELVIQKTTELGIDEIWPTVTARTDSAARPALLGSRQERWEKVASGAAEQCGRAVVPKITETLTLEELCATPHSGSKIFFLPDSPNGASLSTIRPSTTPLILVGPPGGFEEWEITQVHEAGFEVARLGPRILRTETAAVAAVVALQLLWGDLG